jgi:membrane dipeptidase
MGREMLRPGIAAAEVWEALPVTQPVFDGHNDVLLHLWRAGDRNGSAFFEGRPAGHIDLAKARAGGLAGGFFAVYVPNPAGSVAIAQGDDGKVENMPPIAGVPAPEALRVTLGIAAILRRMTAARPDAIRLCRDAGEIEAARAAGAIAAILHLEGAEAIGESLDELEILHAAGLRSLGPVWSRPNIFGHGVPFRFPSSPDTGPGLTDAGRRLVAECNRLGIVVDLSHLNEAGFREVAKLSDAPLVATHSNVHAIAPSARNLTDLQLDAIAASGGVVGLNFAVSFLREDGRRISATPLDLCVRHLAHLVERLGEKGVALGSDFDGALIPEGIGSAAGLPNLVRAMEEAQFGETLVRRICWQNWVDLVARTVRPV